ncbi:hypothetical protein LRP49_06365 [Enterovibrio sp. ZSDZ35]|uniref:LPP20 lipoprotein n=1 Tax=Enterovibrio qingdaonensis TaxID=2899818 RepID=A0ABT5QIL3_9GAMM|nr:hypothetical protein [Enterovibrio sp. ZSDZ35]MDD1780822.1 hypothetical protein [Enterovibrio sp. ZSDZ35]
MKKNILAALIAVTAVAGCASNSSSSSSAPQDNGVPSWIHKPLSSKGVAVASCVEYSGSYNADYNYAEMEGRTRLMRSFESRVSNLQKTLKSQSRQEAGVVNTAQFEDAAKNVVNGKLKSAFIEDSALVSIFGKDQVCLLMTMPSQETKEIFNELTEESQNISPDDRDAMYQEFLAERAEADLDSTLKATN